MGPAPSFLPISIVSKRSPVSATAELLLCNVNRSHLTLQQLLDITYSWATDQPQDFVMEQVCAV